MRTIEFLTPNLVHLQTNGSTAGTIIVNNRSVTSNVSNIVSIIFCFIFLCKLHFFSISLIS
nr:MAG TPA: hypothetical protein [Caudoviricetes sp.]